MHYAPYHFLWRVCNACLRPYNSAIPFASELIAFDTSPFSLESSIPSLSSETISLSIAAFALDSAGLALSNATVSLSIAAS
jgi:hypothetical protein